MLLDNVAFLAIDITVSKCYLEALYQEGLQPSEVVYVKINRKAVSLTYKQRIKSFLRSILKPKTNSPAINQEDEKQKKDFLAHLDQNIRTHLQTERLPLADYELSTPEILQKYEVEYSELTVSNINDPTMVDFLTNRVKSKYVIFSGGGILRKPILDTKRFVHIHPGVVPNVKGAHCFLWSALVREKIGMSAFFMNAGIDTGDIISTKEYTKPLLQIAISDKLVSLAGKYVINNMDPSYRADLLLSLFKKEPDPAKWTTVKQKADEGKTYYFMHTDIMNLALKSISAKD